MRKSLFALACLALLAASCRKKQVLEKPPEGANAIPREVALSELRAVLPTAEAIYCTLPKDSWKPSEIKEWVIEADHVELRFRKGDPLRFAYSELTKIMTGKDKSFFYAFLYTEAQKDPNREHFSFGWRNHETAKQAVELFEALRARQ